MTVASYVYEGLPVNWLGVALISVALLLFVVDLKVVGHGLPALWGVVALVLGILVLLDLTSPYSWVSLVVLGTIVGNTGVIFLTSLSGALAIRGRPTTTGAEGMIGETGVVREPIGADSQGWVFVHGELWRAVPAVAPEDAHKGEHQHVIGVGRRVQVVGLRDGKVMVLPLETSGHPPES